jgi:hypothetical protein
MNLYGTLTGGSLGSSSNGQPALAQRNSIDAHASLVWWYVRRSRIHDDAWHSCVRGVQWMGFRLTIWAPH